jgi:hypothetical protein
MDSVMVLECGVFRRFGLLLSSHSGGNRRTPNRILPVVEMTGLRTTFGGTMGLCITGLVAACLLSVVGCQPRPKAPALLDEPVYQNDQEGFRFLVPDGWIVAARANVPPGPVTKERLLVEYRRAAAGPRAMLEVSLVDLPASTNLAEYLAGPSFGVSRWKPLGEPQTLEAGGKSAQRFRFAGQAGKTELAREVTVFQRGGRVYLFAVLSTSGDETAAEQVRRALGGLIWTK